MRPLHPPAWQHPACRFHPLPQLHTRTGALTYGYDLECMCLPSHVFILTDAHNAQKECKSVGLLGVKGFHGQPEEWEARCGEILRKEGMSPNQKYRRAHVHYRGFSLFSLYVPEHTQTYPIQQGSFPWLGSLWGQYTSRYSSAPGFFLL